MSSEHPTDSAINPVMENLTENPAVNPTTEPAEPVEPVVTFDENGRPNIGPMAVSETEKSATMLYKIDESQRRIGRSIDPELGRDMPHRFWGIQPVPAFNEFVVHQGRITEELPELQQLTFKNTMGVSNYQWSDFELAEFSEIYCTDTEKYTVHSPLKTMQAWVDGHEVYRVGIRRTSNGKLVGAIIGRKITAVIEGTAQEIIEMGWMYVSPKYRKKNMAVFLIQEFCRVTGRKVSALFSVNFILPTPTTTWSTCIRELQPEKLTSLIPVDGKESIGEKARTLELRPELLAKGLRRATADDAANISAFLDTICAYDIWRKWSPEQITALIANGTCWVVERTDGNEEGGTVTSITDFVAWADQEWRPRHPWNVELPVVRVAHVVLQAFGCDSEEPITRVITDLMIHARDAGYHVFQTEKIGDSEMYASNLRFVEWGYPRYLNTYNYRIPSLGAKQVGFPIGWNV